MPPNIAPYYDAVINWKKRLAREMPLIERLARAAGPKIMVPGCGTGGHVVALAQRGFDVLGFDSDPSTVEFTRRRIVSAATAIAAASGKADVRLLAMENAAELGSEFDAAFCLGNALPGLSQEGQVLAALASMAKALRKGGVLLTQNLNYDLRWRLRVSEFPLLSGETPREEVLLVKFADYQADHINFHGLFLVREKPAGKWQSFPRASRQIPVFRELLADLATRAGFGELQFWGDYAETPFDPEKSNDLILAAHKL
jgi:SAM-dependent methyltransferase